MRVFADFHHSSLLRSLVLLFENRLGFELYRPIGMDWFEEGFWAINNQRDTAEQFLSLDQAIKPGDNTPQLNVARELEYGTYKCADAGGRTFHNACTLEWFKNNKFDFVIASVPAHVKPMQELIKLYNPGAKLLIQMGNNWDIMQYEGMNVLASIAPQFAPGVNAMFYHQEFDLSIFTPSEVKPNRKIYSFVNVIQNSGVGWEDYKGLKSSLERNGFDFKSFGGQCPDGNTNGALETAQKMSEAMMIFHVKPGGDGFGHVIHNAYALGRPVITRPSHYRSQLAEQLLIPGTFLDLDKYGRGEAKNMITRLAHSPDQLKEMGERASRRFSEVVDYVREAKEVWQWLDGLV